MNSLQTDDTPGHILVLQSRQSTGKPRHGTPPLSGGGLLHKRVRVRTPPPHVLEHRVNNDQSLQVPFTGPVTNSFLLIKKTDNKLIFFNLF